MSRAAAAGYEAVVGLLIAAVDQGRGEGEDDPQEAVGQGGGKEVNQAEKGIQGLRGRRTDQRPPEDSAGDQKAQVLGDMHPLVGKRLGIKGRHVPDPQGSDAEEPGDQGVPQPAFDARPGISRAKSCRTGVSGRPISSSGGAIRTRSRC